MPIYEVQHAISLTLSQKDELASAITQIHSQKFTTPKIFVQVYFTDVVNTSTYIGGKRRTGNHIRGQVRSGPSRSQKDWNELCKALSDAWYHVVGTKGGGGQDETSLRSVILMGGMVAGLEVGFILPPAGGDVQWLQENWEAFNQKAKEGDDDMADLVQEVQERGLMDGTNGLKVNGV